MPTAQERETLNERELAKLIKLYKDGQADILRTFDNATDFGQARRLEQLANIDRILRTLGTASGEYIDIVLGNSYERGTGEALKQLNLIQVGIKDGTTMSVIDRRAVEALVSETQELFGQSLTRVKGAATKALSTAVRETITDQLATGRIEGQTLKTTAGAIKATIREQGITALVDKGGTEWTLDRYAEMLARTKMVEARNTGLANKMLANGYDLVQVSNHASTHSACAHYEGKILSLSGTDKRYPSLADAKANGLFHPNCRHQINVIQTDYAAILKAYDPASGTYKAPFAANKPIVNPKPTRALTPAANAPITVDGGRFTGLPLIDNKVSVPLSKTKSRDFSFNKTEADFITNTSLRVTTIRNPHFSRISSNTNAYYVPIDHSIHIKNLRNPSIDQTVYHELGHALDARFGGSGKRDEYLTSNRDVTAALRAEKTALIARRLARQPAYDGLGLKPADFDVLAAGGEVPYTLADGRTGKFRVDRTFIRKISTDSELFADGYGLYRTERKEFAKYAPTLFKIYEELIK